MATTTESADDLRAFAVAVVRRLREAGHQALWAGGCVRDLLLGTRPKDYDVATSARPEDVPRLFRRTLAIGASFGVMQVRGTSGHAIEVATFRADLGYVDGRHPVAVAFADAQADAQRRDFTINGMFFDPLADQVLDFVGGQNDLEQKVIRAIGDPLQRFAEDKLRLLRGVRFAARLGFTIDPATFEAMRARAHELPVVSAERVLMELRLLLVPPTRTLALDLMRPAGLLAPTFSELADGWLDDEAWRATRDALARWPMSVSLPLALAGLLAATPDDRAAVTAETMLRRLKATNDERERTVWLTEHRRALANAVCLRVATLKRLMAHPGFAELLLLHEALGGHADAAYCRRRLVEWSPAEIDPPPLVTGHDLLAAGLPPGPRFKTLLDQIRDLQLDGRIATRDQAIQAIAECQAANSG